MAGSQFAKTVRTQRIQPKTVVEFPGFFHRCTKDKPGVERQEVQPAQDAQDLYRPVFGLNTEGPENDVFERIKLIREKRQNGHRGHCESCGIKTIPGLDPGHHHYGLDQK